MNSKHAGQNTESNGYPATAVTLPHAARERRLTPNPSDTYLTNAKTSRYLIAIMGGVVSTIKLLVGFCISLRSSIAPVVKRIQSDPGRPCSNPTRSFWLLKPHPHVSQHQSAELPSEVDVVIIGSGITGIAVAKTLLEPPDGKAQGEPLRVAMLEAREACSGATGRNGGHIKESAYLEYGFLKKKYGKEVAMEVIRFRLAHLDALIAVAEAEGEEVVKESRIRRCETVDVCFEEEVWEETKAKLEVFLEDFEDQRGLWVVHEMEEARKVRVRNIPFIFFCTCFCTLNDHWPIVRGLSTPKPRCDTTRNLQLMAKPHDQLN